MILNGFLGYPNAYAWLHDWLPIIFMGLLVVAVFALMRFMPRTRPAETKPDKTPAIGWADIAGSDEAKRSLPRNRPPSDLPSCMRALSAWTLPAGSRGRCSRRPASTPGVGARRPLRSKVSSACAAE